MMPEAPIPGRRRSSAQHHAPELTLFPPTVAWNWGSGAPGGVAAEVVTDGEAKMVSHRGNEVTKQGSPENPAVHIERPGNDVVKKASELEVEEEGPKHSGGGEGEKKEEEKKKDEDEKKDEQDKANGAAEPKTGEKRSADEANKDATPAAAEKKDEPKANGDAAAQPPPKKKGRPAKNEGAPKKEQKKKAPKPAATADGKPRRSGRNKA